MSERGEGRLLGKLAPVRQYYYADVRTGESCHKHFVTDLLNTDRSLEADGLSSCLEDKIGAAII